MARTDPTGDGPVVALKLPARQTTFLREVFVGAQAELLDDLTNFPGGLRDPDRSRREARICERVLAALSGAVIKPDWEILAMLRETAWGHDDANEYERIVFEHRAFCGLLRQLEMGRRD